MQNTTTVKKRLALFLKHLNIGQAKFAEIVGVSKGFANNVGDSIRTDNLEKISKAYPELNIAWLQTGIGEMLQNEKKVVSLPEVGTQLELDFSKVVDACHKAAGAAEASAKTAQANAESTQRLVISNDKLVDNNTKLIDKLLTSIDRLEKKIDQKGAAEDAKNVVKREDRG